MHLDWGASQFLTKQWQVGLVGYLYQEIGCDSGAGDRVGCFQSRVVSVGPQIGYIFPVGDKMQGYLNLKAYGEFAAGGLEPLADVQSFACGGNPARALKADVHEIEAPVPTHLLVTT